MEPRTLRAGPLRRAFACIVLPAAAAIALPGCGLMSTLVGDSQIVSYEYRPRFGFVRIERIETGAPENAHPFAISADALARTLARLEVEGETADPVFTQEELDGLAPHVAAALAKAAPAE